jgi:hypothetical protein
MTKGNNLYFFWIASLLRSNLFPAEKDVSRETIHKGMVLNYEIASEQGSSQLTVCGGVIAPTPASDFAELRF